MLINSRQLGRARQRQPVKVSVTLPPPVQNFDPATLYTGGTYGYVLDTAATNWQDSTATTPGATGQPVGRLNDVSGNGKHFLQTVTGSRPVKQSDGTLLFDGTDDHLRIEEAGLYAAGTTTIVMVVGGSSQADRRFLAEGDTTSTRPMYTPFTCTPNAGGSNLKAFIRTVADVGIVGNPTDGLGVNSVATPLNNTGLHVITIIDTGSSIILSVDQGTPETVNYSRAGASIPLTITGFGALVRATVSAYFIGKLGRTVAIGRQLDPTEILNAERWVASGHGITLPSDVPVGPPAGFTQAGTFTVTEQSGATLTDYQVPVTVPWKSGMNTDMSNVAFKNTDNSDLAAWLQPDTLVPGTSAKFWVKIPSLTASAARICSYGTRSDADVNNGDNVFLFFDAFEGVNDLDETLNGTKWTAGASNTGSGRYGWLDRWQIINSPISGAADGSAQGMCCNATHYFVGRDMGTDVDGRIYKYDRSTNQVVGTYFAGPPHSNTLSINHRGNIIAGGGGNQGSRREVWEIAPDGTLIEIWDVTNASNMPNACHYAPNQIIGSKTDANNGNNVSEITVINIPPGGPATVQHTYNILTTAGSGRAQGTQYHNGVFGLLVDDVGLNSNAAGSLLRFQLDNVALTATFIDRWRHLPGGEREGIFYDAPNDRWFYSDHAGTIHELRISAKRQAQVLNQNSTTINNWFGNTALPADFAVMTRSFGSGYYFGFGGVATPDLQNMIDINRGDPANGDLYIETKSGNTVTNGIRINGNDPGSSVSNYEVRRLGTTATFHRNNTLLSTVNTGVPTSTNLRPALLAGNYGATAPVRGGWEYMAARKIVATEPNVVVT